MMGVAHEWRTAKMFRRQWDRRLAEESVTLHLRKLLWIDAIKAGMILVFRRSDARACITVGPYQAAIEDPRGPQFAAICGGWRGFEEYGSAEDVVRKIMPYIGRRRPINAEPED